MAGHLTEEDLLAHFANIAGGRGAMSFEDGGPVDDDDPDDEKEDTSEDDDQDKMVADNAELPANAQPTSQPGGMSDADMGLSDKDMAGGTKALSDADMGLSDADMDEDKPKISQGEAFTKHALKSAPVVAGSLPAIGAMASAGASIGAGLGPVGAGVGGVAGALIGAISGGYLVSNVEDWFLDKLGMTGDGGIFDAKRMSEAEQQHPYASFAGDLAPNVAAFGMGKGLQIGARAAGAAIFGGLEAGQQAASDQGFDPVKIAMAAGAGGAFPQARPLAEKAMGLGARFAGGGSKTKPGRPNVEVTPEVEADRATVDQNDLTTTAAGVAADNPPVNTNVTAGNPQSAPVRSSRKYPKDLKQATNDNAGTTDTGAVETAPSQKGASISDAMRPDISAAMDALSGKTDTPKFNDGNGNNTPPESQSVGKLADNDLVDTSRAQRQGIDNVQQKVQGQQQGEAFNGPEPKGPLNPDRPAQPASAAEHVTVKGDEPPPGPVYDHPEIPGLKVDRTAMVPHVADISTDGKTVFVDKRLPPLIDVAGKKLDPAIPLGVRAAVHKQVYDGPGATRKLAKEAGMAAEKQWLDSRGYDVKAYRQALREATGNAAPKPGTSAIEAARQAMANMPKALKKFNELPPERQPDAARLVLEGITNKKGVPTKTKYAEARIPSQAPTVEGVGKTARTKGEASMRSGVVAAAKEAFQKFAPKEDTVPTTKDAKAALKARLQMAIEHVKRAGEYMPRDKAAVPELKWFADAKKLVNGRMLQRQINDFIANEKLLRSGNKEDVQHAVQTGKIEGQIARQRTPSVEDAEAAQAADHARPLSDDEMIEPPKNIDWENLSDEEIADLHKAQMAADASLQPKVEEALPKWKQDEQDRAANMAKQKAAREGKPVSKTLENFIKDEGGGAKIPDMLTRKPSKDYIARSAQSPEEEYARSIDDRLNATDRRSVSNRGNLRKEAEDWSKEYPQFMSEGTKTQAKLYRAMETDDFSHLTPAENAFYHNEMKPIKDATDQMAALVAKLDPTFEYVPDSGHVHRIAKGYNPSLDEKAGMSADPVTSINRSLNTTTSALKERVFMALEDSGGNRMVVSPSADGFQIWKRGQASKVKWSGDLKVGEKFTDSKGKDWEVKRALTPEIERNARFRNGKFAEYHQNAALSVLKAHADIYDVLQHLKLMEDITNDKDWSKVATRSNNEAKDNEWSLEKTKLYPFDKFYLHPEVKAVFDHYASPGFEGEAMAKWRGVSRGITKLMFWLPTAHIMNVGNHWFVSRGWDWITPTGYRSLAVNGAKAIKSVISQDDFQNVMRDNGAGTVYGGVLNQQWLRNLGREVGLNIEKNPTKWDGVIKTLGLSGAKELADTIYRTSSKVMWAANDVMYTQHVMELVDKGMSVKEAIQKTDRHIPNYRIPAKVMGSRFLSQFLSDPGAMAFGRYHYGVFNSYAHMAKSLVNGTGEQQKEALGQLMMMGVLAFAIKPVLDKAAQYVTGDKNAESRARGPIALPYHFIKAIQGKEDFQSGLKSTLTLPPAVSAALEIYNNKDFANRRVWEPGDLRTAIGNSGASPGKRIAAGGRVAVDAAEGAARSLVSPYGTFANAWGRGANPVEAIRDQALDIQRPSAKALRWQHLQKKRDASEAAHRGAAGRGPAEFLYNKVTR